MLKKYYLCIRKSRGGAVVARWAHNPEVVGSNPAPATKIRNVITKIEVYYLV